MADQTTTNARLRLQEILTNMAEIRLRAAGIVAACDAQAARLKELDAVLKQGDKEHRHDTI